MKKILFFGMLAAMLLGTASCSSEMEQVKGDGEMTFTVQLGDAIDSRTIADGTGANTLYFAVYTADGQHLDLDQTIPVVNKMATVTTKLANNRSYKLVFWAQNNECDAYTFDKNAGTITVDYENVDCDDETRDAFYKMEEVTVGTSEVNRLIILTRPFAQINFLASDKGSVADFADYEYSVTVTDVPTQLNMLDGTVGGETVDVLAFNKKPVLDEELAGYDAYKYLVMNYILAAPEKVLKNEVTMTVYDNSVNTEKTVNVENCPVQRNFRTNIIGDFHSNDSHFYVQIHPMFDGDFFKPNAIPAEEVAAAVTVPGAYVVVEEGSELSLDLRTIAEGVTLDLNGSTLKYAGTNTGLRTINKNHVTIKNGFISNDEISSGGGYALYVNTKNAVISNIDFVGDTRSLDGEINITGTGTPDDVILIEDCNFTTENDSYKAFIIYGTSTVRLNRCAIDGIYPFNCDGAKCDMIVENSTLTGWTSWNNNYDGLGHTMTFNNCKFGAGHRGYAVIRPYNDSYFNNCIIEEPMMWSPRGGNSQMTNCTIVNLDNFLNGGGYETNSQAMSATITIDGVKYVNKGNGYWEIETGPTGSGDGMTDEGDGNE